MNRVETRNREGSEKSSIESVFVFSFLFVSLSCIKVVGHVRLFIERVIWGALV